jgi:mRNA interferase RelE/StbE
MKFGSGSVLRIDWHPAAVDDLARLGRSDQKRIKAAIVQLQSLPDARQRLQAYTATLKGFWKLRVGDFRLVCQIIEHDGQAVLIILVAHRSTVYNARSIRAVQKREQPT